MHSITEYAKLRELSHVMNALSGINKWRVLVFGHPLTILFSIHITLPFVSVVVYTCVVLTVTWCSQKRLGGACLVAFPASLVIGFAFAFAPIIRFLLCLNNVYLHIYCPNNASTIYSFL